MNFTCKPSTILFLLMASLQSSVDLISQNDVVVNLGMNIRGESPEESYNLEEFNDNTLVVSLDVGIAYRSFVLMLNTGQNVLGGGSGWKIGVGPILNKHKRIQFPFTLFYEGYGKENDDQIGVWTRSSYGAELRVVYFVNSAWAIYGGAIGRKDFHLNVRNESNEKLLFTKGFSVGCYYSIIAD